MSLSHMMCQVHCILGVFEGARLSAKVRPVYFVLKVVYCEELFPFILLLSDVRKKNFWLNLQKNINNITRIVCNSQVRFCLGLS